MLKFFKFDVPSSLTLLFLRYFWSCTWKIQIKRYRISFSILGTSVFGAMSSLKHPKGCHRATAKDHWTARKQNARLERDEVPSPLRVSLNPAFLHRNIYTIHTSEKFPTSQHDVGIIMLTFWGFHCFFRFCWGMSIPQKKSKPVAHLLNGFSGSFCPRNGLVMKPSMSRPYWILMVGVISPQTKWLVQYGIPAMDD